MTGEIELRTERADLAKWAEEARLVHQIAVSLAGTSFVPKSMQGRPDEVTGAILAGGELGLQPMSSLRAVDIIDGTPALRAMALRGLVQAHGHDIWLEESTETRAVVMGRRKGKPEVQKSVWTMDRARKAGLAGKKNWTTQPQAMLVARSTAECARLVASDVLIALPYIAEELADEGPVDAITAKTSKPAKRTAQRKPLPELPAVAPFAPESVAQAMAETGPSVDDIEPDGVLPADGMSDGMRRALMAAYRELGITDRAERLEHASRIVGRKLGSANELSHAEGHDLLAALEAEAARREPQDGEPS